MRPGFLMSSLMLSALAGCAVAPASPAAPGDARAAAELAPTGTLRFGLVYAPEPSTLFVVKDPAGQPVGVAVDLARDLARRLGRPVSFVLAPNTGQLTDGLAAGTIDAAFMPVDDERRKRLDFGPAYAVGENTYLVRAGSDIGAIADVDRAGVRVIGVANTTTIRSVAGYLKQTRIAPVESVGEALAMLRRGEADAFALTRDTLATLAPAVPGSRILDGAFRRLDIAIALPQNRPAALAYVSLWMRDATQSGTVRRAFDAAGFAGATIPQ